MGSVVAYNGNKLYSLVTGGRDGSLAFWDSRKAAAPLVEMKEHSHGVTAVGFNGSYDEFVVSGSYDGLVKLYSVRSVSSKTESDGPSAAGGVDHVTKTYQAHDDSVYGVEWSRGEAWIFASLSADGSFAVHHIPREAKMHALINE